MSDPVIILGAGPAGLACAYGILKASRKKVIILDKAPGVGGMGSSFTWNNHTLDIGPHAFHTRGGEPETLIRSLFKEEPHKLIEGTKKVSVYLKDKRFKYPLQISEALLKFNPLLSARIIAEFLLTSIFHALVSIPIENFENWGRKRFGATLFRMSFGDYTEKVWKTKSEKISEKFASEKIQGFKFVNLIFKLLRIGGQITEPYYQTWLYHRQGSGFLYNRLAEKIRDLGGEINLSANVVSIKQQQNQVISLTYQNGEQSFEVPCSWLVNTIPLPKFIELLGNHVPFAARYNARKLHYISLMIVYLEFNVKQIMEDHWLYLLENKFVFNRITEQRNLSHDTIVPGKTVLSLEITCREGDEFWQMSDEDLFTLAKDDCRNIGFIRAHLHALSGYHVKRITNVYEIYYKYFDQSAEPALAYLKEIRNVCTTGRRGLFLQGDMHQSIEMGLDMGNILVQDTPVLQQLDEFYGKYLKYLDVF
jgi:protoporphyrinogen oxidase